jgi:ZIP family zinc transporter
MANREEINGLTQQQIENRLNDRVKQRLNRTGILTAIAIGIHNLPEGIATYLGAIQDTRLGYALAIGIALHNIPEGVAVAIPVYFATGSRFKAFLWTFLSALAEPFGGFICWLIMRKKDKDQVETQNRPYLEGIIFGIIAGVMVTISLKELLPTAHQYCSHTNRVTLSVLGGMAIMAISLILFAYAGV